VAEACGGLARDLVEIAQLLTSELVTNAIQYGSGTIAVEISRSANRLRVTVNDANSERPQRQSPSAEDVRGRGLMLVEALSSRWGTTSTGAGKGVWFELRTA
jgi:two-component sensor histidine kinase